MINLSPKYRRIDLIDLRQENLMALAAGDLRSHVALETDSEELKTLVSKAKGIVSFYEARKVLSPKQRERIIEYLLSVKG